MRLDWRKRKRGETRQAIHTVLHLRWTSIKTALFAVYLSPGSRSFDPPVGRTLREYGITLALIPRIGRKRAESLYYLHLSLLWGTLHRRGSMGKRRHVRGNGDEALTPLAFLW